MGFAISDRPRPNNDARIAQERIWYVKEDHTLTVTKNQHPLNLNDNYLAGFILIISIATVLRFYQLDSQMWLDEFSALNSIRRPWLDIVSNWPGASSHIFYEVLANWSVALFGESAFSIRLPAAIFGIGGVAVVGGLGAKSHSTKTGLFIASLMAVSYNHIFFSQNARGYTALIFFFLLSSYLFLRIIESGRMDWKTGLVYFLVIVLTCYTQPFGVFIPASHFLIALALTVLKPRSRGDNTFPIRTFIYWMAGAGILTFLLYAPLMDGVISHARMNVATPAEGPRFGIGLLVEIVEGLSAAFHGYAGLAIATIAGIIGIVIWLQIHPVSLFLLTLPLVIQGVVFLIMGVGIHPRYFSIAIPIIYFAGGITFFQLTRLILNMMIASVRIQQLIHSVLLGLVVIVSAYPLIRYYSIPKQDFQGALHYVQTLAEPGDIRVGIQSVGSIMKDNYNADFIRVDTLDELLEQEQSQKPIWIVMTLERIMEVADPALVNHIRENYVLLKSFPGTVGDGSMQIYGQPR